MENNSCSYYMDQIRGQFIFVFGFWKGGLVRISMDTKRKVVEFRENFIKAPKEMVLQIRDKSLKEQKHQTG
jgi:hypothetical protein